MACRAPVSFGLLFLALGADLDRQFEFVRRTWINETSIYVLVNEQDSLLSRDNPHGPPTGFFTIPTAVGPIRLRALQSYVDVKGAGYFFLPSRWAIAHVANRSHRPIG